jgi:hypothetical protein
MLATSSKPLRLPGDIVVTPVHSGFLLGRMLPKVELGPWWTFISVVSDYNEATEKARVLALVEGVRAWAQTRADHFDPL